MSLTVWQRVSYAVRAWFSILVHGRLPRDIAKQLLGVDFKEITPERTSATTSVSAAADSGERALQMLALLQREGRLIDFLFEDVSPYPDAQLGAAVRTIHQSCREAVERYVHLAPIVDSEEDRPVNLQAGIDPASIKLIGNITGGQPTLGVLRHRGWRALDINLPSLPEGAGRKVIAPAEVEIS